MTITFAVLGDSLAYGQGASAPTDTVGSRLAADLARQGITADVRILAVPGACSDALADQVRRALACSRPSAAAPPDGRDHSATRSTILPRVRPAANRR